MFTIEQYKEDVGRGCYALPLWVLLLGTVSQLLMVLNSSINFFIYCLMSAVFREVLFERLSAYGRPCVAAAAAVAGRCRVAHVGGGAADRHALAQGDHELEHGEQTHLTD